MSIYHDEIEIEDMEYDEEEETYYYPCPCGDKFEITKVNLCQHSIKLSFTHRCQARAGPGARGRAEAGGCFCA